MGLKWKAQAKKVAELDKDRELGESGGVLAFNPTPRLEGLNISVQRQRLPIFENRQHILYLVEKYRTVVIVGQTGCGKTTQIPQYLHEGGWSAGGRVIGCTQPRRVAATSVAARVAEEMDVSLGEEVGYSIRFEDCTDPERTRIKYLTDGMLLREMMLDPLLSRYSALMIDEAHERSLATDVLLGLLKKIMKKRTDLKIIVSSATLDAEMFKEFFETNRDSKRRPENDTAVIMSVEGRMYPVDVHYLTKPCADYVQSSVNAVMDIHRNEPPGDVLVFLTGQEEIENACNLIREEAAAAGVGGSIVVLPIFAGLPPDQQMRVFDPPPRGRRKVVVATNIAETSITIDSIVYVIDCGFVKQKVFDPRTCVESLFATPTSQASAQQRAGRAGRVRPGKCYRMYTEESFHSLPQQTTPDIQRTNVSALVLQLKALGIDDVLHFDFISSPPAETMIRSLEILYSLGALDVMCKLTRPVGQCMAEFPAEPMIAKMLLTSIDYGCEAECLTIAALFSVQGVFMNTTFKELENAKKKFAVVEGDAITYLNVYNSYLGEDEDERLSWCARSLINARAMQRAVEIRKQLSRYLKRFKTEKEKCDEEQRQKRAAERLKKKQEGKEQKKPQKEATGGDSSDSDEEDERDSEREEEIDREAKKTLDRSEAVRKCVISGFFSNAAQRQADGSYITVRGTQTLHIHPSSVLFKYPPEWVVFAEVVYTTKPFMREVTTIDPKWLHEIAPHFYEYRTPTNKRTLGEGSTYSGDKEDPALKFLRPSI